MPKPQRPIASSSSEHKHKIYQKISFNKKVKRQRKGKTNITALIGERCLVIEDISNIHVKGLVNLKGSIWSACCADKNDVIEAGTVVVVERVEGVKLVCSREK